MEKRVGMRGKRGFEMAFGTLVTMILAVILLALVIVFFTGGFNKFKDKIGGFFSDSNVDIVVDSCNRLIAQEAKFDYCCVNKTIKVSSKQNYNMPCLLASNYSWGARIDKIDCSGVC